MIASRVNAVVAALVFLAAGWPVHLNKVAAQTKDAADAPRLINTCVITSNVKRLVDFYEPVLKLKAKWSGEDYAEFPTGVGVFAIFSVKAQEKYMPGSSQASMNRSVILEFRVTDVDLEYRRLQGLVKVWAKPPFTQPWGTRSVYFRDPDGNLVDFFTPPAS